MSNGRDVHLGLASEAVWVGSETTEKKGKRQAQ